MIKKTLAMLLVTISISSCTKQELGTGIGALSGAAIGSNIGKGEGRNAAIILGAIAGGIAGNRIGGMLDEADKRYYDNTSHEALEYARSGQTRSWSNPDSGNSGSFTIQKTYQNRSGSYCREFMQKVIVAGKTQEAYGTACRQEDGSWKIVQ